MHELEVGSVKTCGITMSVYIATTHFEKNSDFYTTPHSGPNPFPFPLPAGESHDRTEFLPDVQAHLLLRFHSAPLHLRVLSGVQGGGHRRRQLGLRWTGHSVSWNDRSYIQKG